MSSLIGVCGLKVFGRFFQKVVGMGETHNGPIFLSRFGFSVRRISMIVFLSTDICAQTRDFCSKKGSKERPPASVARVGRQANLVIVKTLCTRVYLSGGEVFFWVCQSKKSSATLVIGCIFPPFRKRRGRVVVAIALTLFCSCGTITAVKGV